MMSTPEHAAELAASPPPIEGIGSAPLEGVYDMEEAAYHARPEISKHDLDALDRAPALFLHQRSAPKDPTPAMRFGSLLHRVVLEPDRFEAETVLMPAGIDRRTKDGKAAWAAFEAQAVGLEIVTQQELDQLHAIREAVFSHPSAAQLLAPGGRVEASLFWLDSETGVRCRGRVDKVHPSQKILVDLKSTKDASAQAFARSCWNLRYDVQAAFYLDGWATVGPVLESPPQFCWIAVETEPPYLVACYVATPAMIEAGRERYRRNLRRYAECLAADQWPGLSDRIEPLDLPAWAVRSLEPTP